MKRTFLRSHFEAYARALDSAILRACEPFELPERDSFTVAGLAALLYRADKRQCSESGAFIDADGETGEAAAAFLASMIDAENAAEAGKPVAPSPLAALRRCVPWLGKMIADGGHLQAVAPNDAVRSLQMAEAAIAAAEPGAIRPTAAEILARPTAAPSESQTLAEAALELLALIQSDRPAALAIHEGAVPRIAELVRDVQALAERERAFAQAGGRTRRAGDRITADAGRAMMALAFPGLAEAADAAETIGDAPPADTRQ